MQELDSIHNTESKIPQDSNPLKEARNTESKQNLDSKKDISLNAQYDKNIESCNIDPKSEKKISSIESKHNLDSRKNTLLNMQGDKILESTPLWAGAERGVHFDGFLETSNCDVEWSGISSLNSQTDENLETTTNTNENLAVVSLSDFSSFQGKSEGSYLNDNDRVLSKKSVKNTKETTQQQKSKSTFHAPSKINPQFITTFKKSCIIISNDFESEKNYLSNTYAKEDIRIYDLEELKMDNAHEIIEEAHIATTRDKIIAIFAFSYNHYAQNALLKILEEPPSHIIFMLYITARNKLIPTIFSRLVVFNKSKKTHTKPINLDLTRLTIPMVYEYVSKLEKEHISYEQGRNILSQILDSMMTNNIMLDEKGLERFDLALKALYSKQSVHIALLPLLLSLVKG